MLKCKKYFSSICLVFCLSIIILLIAGFQGCVENTRHDDTLLNTKIENKKQNHVVSGNAVYSAKNDLPNATKQNHVVSENAVDSTKNDLSNATKQKHVVPGNAVDSAKNDLSNATKQNSPDEDSKTKIEEEQDLMEGALELLELADNYWKKGDIENTLDTLDKAYALILDTNGNVEIARQKDDLRLLISRRILAVYSSKQTKTNGKASEILLSMNADVEKEIRSFQGPEREFFISSYQRSGMYKEIIVGELRKAGIPEGLFWLPLVESGFKVSAYSRARALGLWQFIPSTGYKFGLTRDEWVDERMDVLKSTHAAIAYLKELHSMFGDWLTVLAAYNCGEGRVLRVISRQHINYFDRFWDLYSQLPNETARYVPRFLATLYIIKNPGKYGFNLQTTTDSLLNYETVKVNKMMKLASVASKLEVSEDTINILNAELRYKTTPNREYELKIPKGSLQKFNIVYSDIPETERPSLSYSSKNNSDSRRSFYTKHRVRPGETVASIARRYRVSTQTIFESNRINKKKRLLKGQIILIPLNRVETADVEQKPSGSRNLKARKTAGPFKTYKVKPGDSLLDIAKRFHVPVAKLKEINKLKTNSIQAGQTLKLPCDEVGNNSDEKQATEINLAKNELDAIRLR